MENSRSVPMYGMLLSAIAVVSAGCSVSPPHPTQGSLQQVPAAAPSLVMPYAASGADQPAIKR